MGLISLTAYPRSETGKNENRRLRAGGRTPAIIYGNERQAAASLEVDTAQLVRILKHSGRSPLFNLTIEGEADSCIAVLREVQAHPVSDEIFHIDLMEIPQGVPVRLVVGLDITGESRAVRSGDAVLDVARRAVEVECRPRHVPDSIAVDISGLGVGDKLCVSDLTLENGEILTDGDEVILKLNPNSIVDEDEPAEAAEGDAAE
ncbi:MAG TPA: 50S ribosomal protein L25 [Candidatus Krumholzibacteria bacterium]|nr:50S ribosomal protein L25 [Candidatus Krumholzibacteria bacterium]HRX50084.1 50S ribosomal protein L25 [Candidatus Krumholzibacteria bacterium]